MFMVLFTHAHITAVASDKDTKDLKGHTVMSQEERCESVRHCKYVDLVICPAPWTVNLDFLTEHKVPARAQGAFLH